MGTVLMPATADRPGKTTREELGQQTIEGVTATGTRTITFLLLIEFWSAVMRCSGARSTSTILSTKLRQSNPEASPETPRSISIFDQLFSVNRAPAVHTQKNQNSDGEPRRPSA